MAVPDDAEFVAFVERSGNRLCEAAFLLCRDWNFAQDLTQITLIKVYRSWRRIRREDPYWYGQQVLLRTYLDHKRLKSSTELQTDAVPDGPGAADSTELRLTLLDALGQLSPRDRAIIVLRYWEDHSIQTVAELMGLSPAVVKMQSMRALAKLRLLLGEDEPLPAPPKGIEDKYGVSRGLRAAVAGGDVGRLSLVVRAGYRAMRTVAGLA